jgi:hypothetical protein
MDVDVESVKERGVFEGLSVGTVEDMNVGVY